MPDSLSNRACVRGGTRLIAERVVSLCEVFFPEYCGNAE